MSAHHLYKNDLSQFLGPELFMHREEVALYDFNLLTINHDIFGTTNTTCKNLLVLRVSDKKLQIFDKPWSLNCPS